MCQIKITLWLQLFYTCEIFYVDILIKEKIVLSRKMIKHTYRRASMTWENVTDSCDLIIMFLSSEIPPAERITSATQANNANKEPHTTTEQIEISEY